MHPRAEILLRDLKGGLIGLGVVDHRRFPWR
jgi:hypothetical protein